MLGPLAALLLAAAPTTSAASAAGLYEIRQMEMAGGLELRRDGRFRYALDYGAVSEEGAGKWRQLGDTIVLTSDPMPRAPDFAVVRDDPAPAGELTVRLEPPGFGSEGYRLRLLARAKGSPELRELDLDEEGHAQLGPDMPDAVIPEVPVYDDTATPIPLAPGRGHRLLLRFLPNDLGKARFDGVRLTRTAHGLVLHRYGAEIVLYPRPR